MGLQISFSAAERYLLSPMSYFLHYFLRLREVQGSSALIFGNSIDSGLNYLLQTKDLKAAKKVFEETLTISDYKDLRIKGTVKFSKADLDESLIDGLEIPENHDPAWYSLREKGCMMLEAYAEQVLPRIKEVHAIQHEIKLDNASGDTFIGIADLICTFDNNKVVLFDNKTASKKYADNAVEESSQLSTYYEALKDEFKIEEVGYIVLPKNLRKNKKPRCEIQILTGKPNEELIDVTFQKYDEVLDGIKNAKFICTGKCNQQYWGRCCYENYCKSGGKDLTGLVYKK